MEYLIMYFYRLRIMRLFFLFWGDGGIVLFELFFFWFEIEMGVGLKKDFRVFRVGLGGFFNVFFFFFIGVIL